MLSRPLTVPLILLVGLASPALRAEELSLKVENYIFAATDALDDGDAELALSLLLKARDEDAEACIVEEYLCRAHAALLDVEQARAAQQRFGACMDPGDEAVLAELGELVANAERQAALEPDAAPVAIIPLEDVEPIDGDGEAETANEDVATTDPATAEQPQPVQPAPPVVSTPPIAAVPAPAPERGGSGWLGWTMMGSGLVIGAGSGVAAYMTEMWGLHYIDRGKQEKYEEIQPYNHIAVYGAVGGGALALTGLVAGLVATHGERQPVSATPWLAPSQQGLGLSTTVEF